MSKRRAVMSADFATVVATSMAFRPSLSSLVTISTSSRSSLSNNRTKPGRCAIAEEPDTFSKMTRYEPSRGSSRATSAPCLPGGFPFQASDNPAAIYIFQVVLHLIPRYILTNTFGIKAKTYMPLRDAPLTAILGQCS